MSIAILLLEDDSKKAQAIRHVLCQIRDINEEYVTTVSDVNFARRELSEKKFDILLLDVQVPTRFDREPERVGGISLFKEILSSHRLNVPSYVIGLTAFGERITEIDQEARDMLWAIIEYDVGDSSWASQLTNRIRFVQHVSRTATSSTTDYGVDIGIICALNDPELSAVKSLSQGWQELRAPNDSTNYYMGSFAEQGLEIRFVAAAATQMGMPAAAVLSMNMVTAFHPRFLCMVGIAAGVRGRVAIGDIVVGDPCWDYGSGKLVLKNGNSTFEPEPSQLRLDNDVMSIFQSMRTERAWLDAIKSGWKGKAPETSLNLHIGAFASGAAVLADPIRVREIKEHHRKLIGLDMEAYGVMYAAGNCSQPRPKGIVIKSVSDFADEAKSDEYQSYCAYSSVAILRHWALTYSKGINPGQRAFVANIRE